MLSNNPDVGDRLLPTADSPRWVGHPGDAYGMISNMYFDPQGDDGYVYYCAGMGDDPYAYAEDNFFSFDHAIIDALFTEVFAD